MPERNRWQYRKWALARFFYDLDDPREDELTALTTDIEARVAADAPDVEVLLVEVVDGDTLRLYIDHPDGITFAHCEHVTQLLGDYREQYAIEVSSPGEDRPLTKPQHFRRFLGQRARLRLREARDGDTRVRYGRAGRRLRAGGDDRRRRRGRFDPLRADRPLQPCTW